MSESSGKDMSVYEFNETTAELARVSLIRRSPKKAGRTTLTKDDFRDCFSRKGIVQHTDTGEGSMSEYEISDVHNKRTGENSGEQCDSITSSCEFVPLINSISLQANDAGTSMGNNFGEQRDGSPSGSEAGQMTNSTSQEAKEMILSEQVISKLENCDQEDLQTESPDGDASMHTVSNNDNDEQTTCTTPDPSQDMHVDLSSEDEDLTAMKFSPSNAMCDPSDEEGASEYSTPDTCHDSDGYLNMEECEDVEVSVTPEFGLCGSNTFLLPRLTFSAEWIRLETMKHNSSCDAVHTFQWNLSDIEYLKTFWLSTVNVAVAMLGLKDNSGVELQTYFGVNGAPYVLFAFQDSGWIRQEHRILSLSDAYNNFWKSLDESVYSIENTMCGVHSNEYSEEFEGHWLGRFEESLEEFVYPKGDPDAVTISGRDVELLDPGVFINDTLIDFYIKYLQSEISESRRQACHFFNSFFFRKLADLDKFPDTEVVSREAFLRVRKWTRRVNIFEKDYIFIPVNYSYHWSLIIICNPGAAILEDGNQSKTPCILHMDSLNGTHGNLSKLIQSYLWEEWRERHMADDTSFVTAEKFYNMAFISLEVPQQNNYHDCGLFLLHYVEMFLRQVPTTFSLPQLANTAYFLTNDWFVPAEASSLKRLHIRQLIYKLHKSFSSTGPMLSCGTGQQSYKAAQNDAGTSMDVEFVFEDNSANQRSSENSVLLEDTLKQNSVCHMDKDIEQTSVCQTSKDALIEGSGKALGDVPTECGEAEHHFKCDEGVRSQSLSLQQWKSTLRHTVESVDKNTEDPSGHQVNEFPSGIFNLIGTNEPGQYEQKTVDVGVSMEMTLGVQFDLSANEGYVNTDQLLYQRDEHSGSSERVLGVEISEDSLQCVRKRVACDSTAWKKLKVFVDRVDEPGDKKSEENENAASVLQLNKANELKLLPEQSSPCAGQISKTDEMLVSERVVIGEGLQGITCQGIDMQRLEQGSGLSLKTGFSDNIDSFPPVEKKFKSFSAEELKLHVVSGVSQCEEVAAGSLEDPGKGIIGSLASLQDPRNSLDCNVAADRTSLDKSNHSFFMGDCARSADKTPENSSRGAYDKECANSISETIEIVDKCALMPSQNDRHSIDSNVYADCTPLNKSKPPFSAEDCARCIDKTPENGFIVAVGRECADTTTKTIGNVDEGANGNMLTGNEDKLNCPEGTFETPAGNEELNVIVHKRECIDSVSKTTGNVGKVIDQKEKAESLPDLEGNTGRTPENRSDVVRDVECTPSNDFSSPPQESSISRNPRSRKTPLTVPKGVNLDGSKGTVHVERPRTRSVTKSMDSGRLARETRRRNHSLHGR